MKQMLFLLTSILVLNCTVSEMPVASSSEPGTVKAMLKAVNELRARGCRCGLKRMPPVPALQWDDLLALAAQRHAGDMASGDFFSHTGSDGSRVSQRATEFGYSWRQIGENIAYNYPNAEAVIAGWQESPPHCRNMMSPGFKQMGAAYQDGYWVQVLGRK